MKSVSLYWWHKDVPNFGDDCSPWVVGHCFGCKVAEGGKFSADLVAVGSVVSTVLYKDRPRKPWTAIGAGIRAGVNRTWRDEIAVWGSGLMFPPEPGVRRQFFRRPRVFACRGPKTLSALQALGALRPEDCHDVALGDPGIFMDEMPIRVSGENHARGVVLHASYWTNGKADAFARSYPDVYLIDPRRPAADVVKDIASCRELFSCSLHGLVAADALGIPNHWVDLEISAADAAGSRFKFDDYYAAFGLQRNPCRLDEVVRARPLDPVDRDRLASVKAGLRSAASEAKAFLEGNGR